MANNAQCRGREWVVGVSGICHSCEAIHSRAPVRSSSSGNGTWWLTARVNSRSDASGNLNRLEFSGERNLCGSPFSGVGKPGNATDHPQSCDCPLHIDLHDCGSAPQTKSRSHCCAGSSPEPEVLRTRFGYPLTPHPSESPRDPPDRELSIQLARMVKSWSLSTEFSIMAGRPPKVDHIRDSFVDAIHSAKAVPFRACRFSNAIPPYKDLDYIRSMSDALWNWHS